MFILLNANRKLQNLIFNFSFKKVFFSHANMKQRFGVPSVLLSLINMTSKEACRRDFRPLVILSYIQPNAKINLVLDFMSILQRRFFSMTTVDMYYCV